MPSRQTQIPVSPPVCASSVSSHYARAQINRGGGSQPGHHTPKRRSDGALSPQRAAAPLLPAR